MLARFKNNTYLCTVKIYKGREAAAPTKAANFMSDWSETKCGNRVGQWKHPQRHPL